MASAFSIVSFCAGASLSSASFRGSNFFAIARSFAVAKTSFPTTGSGLPGKAICQRSERARKPATKRNTRLVTRNCLPIVLWLVDHRYLRKMPISALPWPGSCESLIVPLVSPELPDGRRLGRVADFVLQPVVEGRGRLHVQEAAHRVVAHAAELRARDLEDAQSVLALGQVAVGDLALLQDPDLLGHAVDRGDLVDAVLLVVAQDGDLVLEVRAARLEVLVGLVLVELDPDLLLLEVGGLHPLVVLEDVDAPALLVGLGGLADVDQEEAVRLEPGLLAQARDGVLLHAHQRDEDAVDDVLRAQVEEGRVAEGQVDVGEVGVLV